MLIFKRGVIIPTRIEIVEIVIILLISFVIYAEEEVNRKKMELFFGK